MSEVKSNYSVEETIQIQMVKLNLQLKKLIEQNEKIIDLQNERDTLAAQVESLLDDHKEFVKKEFQLLKEIERLEIELKKRDEQNAALAAQVEALRKALAALSVQAESALQEDIVCYSALKRAQREADYVLDKTPQHHLRELRAEAVISVIDAHKNNVMTFGFDSAIRVTNLIKYAEQIRKGEVK